MIANNNKLYALAVRQILIQKRVNQVVLKERPFENENARPMMAHYDGNFVPIDIVTVPESIQEAYREKHWTPEVIRKSVCLSCEDNGYLYAELFEGGDGNEITWKELFEAVYDILADKDNDPTAEDWLGDFADAVEDGVPQYARALRGYLLSKGYNEKNPLRLKKEIVLTEYVDIPGWTEPISHRTQVLWPSENTVAFTDIHDGQTLLVRNGDDVRSRASLTWNVDAILKIEDLPEPQEKRLETVIEEIKKVVLDFGGSMECRYEFPDYIIEIDAEGTLTITDLLVENGVLMFAYESYTEQGRAPADEFEPEAVRAIRDYLFSEQFDSLVVRENISRLLSDSDEENRVPCELDIRPVSAFQVPGDGTIWVNLSNIKEPVDFDDLPLDVQKAILHKLQEK